MCQTLLKLVKWMSEHLFLLVEKEADHHWKESIQKFRLLSFAAGKYIINFLSISGMNKNEFNILLQLCRILLWRYFTGSISWNPGYHHVLKIILKQNIYISSSRFTVFIPHNTYLKTPLLRTWALLFPSCWGSF